MSTTCSHAALQLCLCLFFCLYPLSIAYGAKLWGSRFGLRSFLLSLALSVSLFLSHVHKHSSPYPCLCFSLFLPPRGEWSLCISVGSAGSMFRAPEMPSWHCLLSDPSMLADLALTTPNASASQPEAVESLPFLLTTHGHHLTQNSATLSKSYSNADFATSFILPHNLDSSLENDTVKTFNSVPKPSAMPAKVIPESRQLNYAVY